MSLCLRFIVVFILSPVLSVFAAPAVPSHRVSDLSYSQAYAQRIFSVMPRFKQLAQYHWTPLHVNNLPLKVGKYNANIPEIYHRLVLLGDQPAGGDYTSHYYNSLLSLAVARFQWRHGLKPDGDLGKKTLAMLNVTPDNRLAQLQRSMHQWSKFPSNEGSQYILINTANYKLALIKSGKKVMDMRVIVGRTTRQTPELYSKIDGIMLNPKWNIPHSILTKDILPKLIENPHYLEENNIGVFTSWGKNAKRIDPATIDWKHARRKGKFYYFTQLPGDKNALGRIKFLFDNDQDIYLHDTPDTELFDRVRRTLSSGCIRIGQPYRLAEYLIKDDANIDKAQLNQALSNGTTQFVEIKHPVPIYVTYITAWVDKRGKTHFRQDVYKRDSARTAA